ncbi:MAG: DUF1015 family protein [Candidatus Limnocylindrales bacterium]
MPDLQPFRALRYDPGAGQPRDLVSPPYDVISPAQQRALVRRHPRNVVRLDLPPDEPGDPPDERYRRAARDLAAWRSEGTLRTDRQSSVYPYEEGYVVPGTAEQRVQRGFFARLRVDQPGLASGILPHERTLSAPKEDRYRLLRATGINASPVVLLFADGDGAAMRALELAARGDALTDLTDDDGVRHRLWQLPVDDADRGQLASELLRAAAPGPLTIADGHHRYETALRYRDERRRDRSPGDPEPFDYLLALLVPIDQPLTVLATHRVVRDGPAGEALLSAAASLFDVERLPSREALLAAFAPGDAIAAGSQPELSGSPPDDRASAGRLHRIGLWTGGTAALLWARLTAFEPLLDPSASPALRWLDVNLLSVALEQMAGIDRAAGSGGGRIAYTKDPAEALTMVDRGEGAAAFLLAPTSVAEVLRVAAAGETMPQKSTYFYPKQVTGLVLNPHEW